jgi:hypothetical protein
MPFCCEDKALRLIAYILHLLLISILSALLLKVVPYGWDYVAGIWFSTAGNKECNMHTGNFLPTQKIFLLMNFIVI